MATHKGADRPTTALIYTRVSTDEQARDGLSLDTQIADTRRYTAHKGWILGGEYRDVLSGKRDDRPGYQALLAHARRLHQEGKSAAVVVARLDRLGRKVLERVRSRDEFKTLGVSTHSVREGGEVSDVVANILASIAEEEVRQLSERISAVTRHMMANGWHTVGRCIWGYRWRDATAEERTQGAPKKVLELDPETAPYVQQAFKRAANGETIQSIARWVQGLPASIRSDYRMSYQAVRFVLRCPSYAGFVSFPSESGEQPVKGRWPALVSLETWQRVQELTARHKRVPRQASGRHLLTGLLRCPNCGARMVGIDRTEKEKALNKAPGYQCRGSHYYGAAAPDPNCHFRAVKPPVDAAVLAEVSSLVNFAASADPHLQRALHQAWNRLQRPDADNETSQRIAQLEREAAKARGRLTNAARRLVDGELDRSGYELLRDSEQASLDAAVTELTRLSATKQTVVLPTLSEVLNEAGGWGEALKSADVASQREVLTVLIEKVVPVRLSRGKYSADIALTPLGEALRRLSQTVENVAGAA